MTTKIKISSDTSSNGDLVLNAAVTCEGPILNHVIRPGEDRELWISSSSVLTITERHPSMPFTKDDGALISKCGDRGELWASEFFARNPGVAEDTARAWFQNAIEAACDVRRERGDFTRAEKPADEIG